MLFQEFRIKEQEFSTKLHEMKRQLHSQQQMLDAGESPDTVLQKHLVNNFHLLLKIPMIEPYKVEFK